jgi:hypothetical protein
MRRFEMRLVGHRGTNYSTWLIDLGAGENAVRLIHASNCLSTHISAARGLDCNAVLMAVFRQLVKVTIKAGGRQGVYFVERW